MQATQSTSQAGEQTQKTISGMRRLSFYTASPVECCDRCSQGIKHVALIEYKDGTRQKYGMDCINKILAGDNSLKSLFAKNQRMLKQHTTALEVLSRPFDAMPVDARGYYDRGIFFISDDAGKMISGQAGCAFFHPTKTEEKFFGPRSGCSDTLNMAHMTGRSGWEPNTPENWEAKCVYDIENGKIWLASEIERISTFLARILNNATTKSNAS